MSKKKDPTPIPVTRNNKTSRIEVFLSDGTAVVNGVTIPDGAIVNVIAHRWTYTTQAGVNVIPPFYAGTVTLVPADLTNQVINRIADLDTIVDTKDTL